MDPQITLVINSKSIKQVHQTLFSILAGVLNKNEKLKIFIKYKDNILIDVNPHIEVPLSYDEFQEMFNVLLNKLKIKDKSGRVLLSIIKNNISEHLLPNTYQVKLDVKGKKINKEEIREKLKRNETYTFFIGKNDEIEEIRRVSDYELNIVGASNRICELIAELLEVF